MSAPVLEVVGVTKRFGAITANDKVSFAVVPGARHALIGPNGAGKSTLFSLISGSASVTSGTVRFEGEDITRTPQQARAARGLVSTFQHSSLFTSGTVADNVALAVLRRSGHSWRLLRRAHRSPELGSRVAAHVAAVGLEHRADTLVGSLSHGERRQLEIALALATEPKMILLDEPTAGMSPRESARFVDLVRSFPESMSVLIVEHDMNVVFDLATHLTVLHLGAVLADGSPQEVRGRPDVQAAYLGDASLDDLFLEAVSDHPPVRGTR